MGHATAPFSFGPVPWGPGEGPKGQIPGGFSHFFFIRRLQTQHLPFTPPQKYQEFQAPQKNI